MRSVTGTERIPEQLLRPDGTLAVDALLLHIRIDAGDLAALLGLPARSLSPSVGALPPDVRTRLTDFVDIITRVTPWAGSGLWQFARIVWQIAEIRPRASSVGLLHRNGKNGEQR